MAKRNYAERLRALAPILVLVGLVVVIGTLRPGFFNVGSLIVTVADTAILFMLGAGTTFVVMLGSIDLSIQAICSFASVWVRGVSGCDRDGAFDRHSQRTATRLAQNSFLYRDACDQRSIGLSS